MYEYALHQRDHLVDTTIFVTLNSFYIYGEMDRLRTK